MTESAPAAELRFEQARPEDLEALVALVESYYRFDHIAFDRADIRRGLGELLADPSLGRAWLMRLGGAASGYVVLTFGFDHEFGGRVGTLTDLYIEAPYRGRGLGSATLKFVEKQAAELGMVGLELQVEEGNAAARALYRKMGFKAHSRVPMGKRI